MELDRNILSLLMYGESNIISSGVEVHTPSDQSIGKLPIREKIAKKISDITLSGPKDQQFCFHLIGNPGTGKKTLIKRASELMSKGAIIIDLKLYASLDKSTFYDIIYSPLREALIVNSTICLDHFEVFNDVTPQKYEYLDFLMNTIPKFSREIFILSDGNTSNIPTTNKYLSWIDVRVENPTHKESYLLWKYYLGKISYITSVNPRGMANKFKFNPVQIKDTVNSVKSLWQWNGGKTLKMHDLCKCAYNQSISKISDKATLIRAAHTWDQLILDDKEKEEIRNACNQIKYKHIVYDQWGMGSRILYGQGLSMLFAGPPGTGKTMAAQVVANELDLEIYKADLSQIVSKYIGETEKNLNSLFEEAKKSNVILFFDETDAILGKRTQVKDSHDKNSNMETSFLLQKMEEYDGITIMTTNFLENIDKAFFRRISYIIHFAFPDAAAREKIWKNMFPAKMPLSKDINFKYLSEMFEISGGSIKNIAINSAFLAAHTSKEVTMEHIINATVHELKKQGKTLIKDDLGEYAYLI